MFKVLEDFTVKDFLGAGAWKVAYRVASAEHPRDIAAIMFRDPDKSVQDFLREVSILDKLSRSQHPFSGYIAEFYGTRFDNFTKTPFFLEELLLRPLDQIAPLRALSRFMAFSLDLAKGIAFLHENQLVHRDLKLDNCGISYADRVKIFDLGTVTSENSPIVGTILTRAPELLINSKEKKGIATLESDIWALGATLFALRTGNYPFVTRDIINRRRALNLSMKKNIIRLRDPRKIDAVVDQFQEKKSELDTRIMARAHSSAGRKRFRDDVHRAFSGRLGEIISSMLDYEPNKRKNARNYVDSLQECVDEADGLSRSASPRTLERINDAARIEKILRVAQAISSGDIALSQTQRQKFVSEIIQIHGEFSQRSSEIEIASTLSGVLKSLSERPA